MKSNALFSKCGSYRWKLSRLISESKTELIFIGLNPSYGDSERNDQTLIRIINFAQSWGFGRVYVINLFARITTRPEILRYCDDPVGSENDLILERNIRYWLANDLCKLWIGWGVNGKLMNRDKKVLEKIKNKDSKEPYAIGITKKGCPRHPLYVGKNKKLLPFAFDRNLSSYY